MPIPGVVAHDVVGFTRQMGEQGYLAGVRPPAPDDPDWSVVVVPGLAVGEVVDDTEVRALGHPDRDPGAGDAGTLSDLRGGSVLLVNWSPYCGYCSAVADLLAVLVEPLERAGISLVLLAVGAEDANREVVNAAGFGGGVLLRVGDVDPFRAYGTPSAYHLDEEGRLAAPMAGGAEAVLALATGLAGVDPYPLLPGEGSDPVPPGTRYLLTDGACGPLSGDEPRARWSGIRTYRVGDHHVGIRHDTEATAAVLDRLFEGRRVRDRRAGHSYAVALQLSDGTEVIDGIEAAAPDVGSASTPRAGTQDLRLLVAGGVPLVRSRYPSRVLRALLWRLADDTLGYDTEPGHLRVQATAALVDGRGGAVAGADRRVRAVDAGPPGPGRCARGRSAVSRDRPHHRRAGDPRAWRGPRSGRAGGAGRPGGHRQRAAPGAAGPLPARGVGRPPPVGAGRGALLVDGGRGRHALAGVRDRRRHPTAPAARRAVHPDPGVRPLVPVRGGVGGCGGAGPV